MKKEDIIETKLNAIYDKILELDMKFNRIFLEKRLAETKVKKQNNEEELEAIHYELDNLWRKRDEEMEHFNRFNREVVDIKSCE